MRTAFYLAVVIATLFIPSFEARHLRKRAGTDVVSGLLGGAGGGFIGSLTGATGGVVGAISQQQHEEKKKKRGLLGGSVAGSNKELAKRFNAKPDGGFKTKKDEQVIEQLRRSLRHLVGNGPVLEIIVAVVKIYQSGGLTGDPVLYKAVTELLDGGNGGQRSPS